MKYSYHGQVLDHIFMDADETDFWAWVKAGSSYYGQCALVSPDGIVYFLDDYDINMNNLSDAIERIIYGESSDTDPPYVYYQLPAEGATEVNPVTNIKVRMKDDGYGIDESTFEMTVTAGGNPVAGDISEENQSNFLDYRIVFDPDDPLPTETQVTVSVEADDLVGNHMEDEWSFTTASNPGIESVSLGEIKAVFK